METESAGNSSPPEKRVWNRISNQLLFIMALAMVVGFGAMAGFYLHRESAALRGQGERTMGLLARMASRGIQTAMLSGNAEMAHDYVENIKTVPNILDFQILREDGVPAFQDNRTIEAVNRRLGSAAFSPRVKVADQPMAPAPEAALIAAQEGRERELFAYRSDPRGDPVLTVLSPIANHEDCHGCHLPGEGVRGWVKLTTSMASVEREISAARREAGVVFGVGMLFILAIIYVAVRRKVVRRILGMTEAMGHVAGGDLTHQVPGGGCYELNRMAYSFNLMSRELLKSHQGLQGERDKLATIILSAREGIVVTDHDGEVVLVNPAAERLLGKTAKEVAEQEFINLLDDPDYLKNLLGSYDQSMPETVVYNNRMLNIYAASIRSEDGRPVGSAALLRDVTEEKRLEEKLRQFSYTDGLTGLNNRRRLDEILVDEFERAKRYGLELAVLLFDVDHFKRFNDQHGHDQGDRVLQAIGRVMKGLFRTVDYPSRYGGEEFCVVMPSTGLEGATMVAERLRQRVEEMVVDGLKVTISIGVAIFPIQPVENADALVKEADQSLYQAKHQGRNQVCCAAIEPAKIGHGPADSRS
ncbi:MAG: diguanylate cyclase [Magnetococcales bacterium]|nr:diguanylate cyclase [Magnetococcales bacterium]